MRYLYLMLLVAVIGIIVLLYQSNSEEMSSSWMSYGDAVNESKKTGKMLFIFISSPTCPVCKEFRDFFSKEGVMDKISAKYLPVYVKDPAYSPVPVNTFPTFCVGYPDNLKCFYASSGEMLLKKLEVG
ncbi:MAG: thioredoxin family protein [Archaeoglobi archaeon]|nr:thioredoxin family protein [Archaeoglobi archaeon]